MTTGMHTYHGKTLSGIDHLNQSITDILTTPIGSRVMRRNYGSYLFELIDQATNETCRLQLMAATADALIRWEPRLSLTHVSVDTCFDGTAQIVLTGRYNNHAVSLTFPTVLSKIGNNS